MLTTRHRSLVDSERQKNGKRMALLTTLHTPKKRFEHIELPAKLLDYFIQSSKSSINQSLHTKPPVPASVVLAIRPGPWIWYQKLCFFLCFFVICYFLFLFVLLPFPRRCIRVEKLNASACRLLAAAMLERWPQVCGVKITFEVLPTNLFIFTKTNLMKCLSNINWIP